MRVSRLSSTLVGIATSVLLVSAVACSSGDGSGGSSCASNGDASVSFVNDVVPIFKRSCAFTGCHNDPTQASQLEFLADPTSDVSSYAAQVYSGIVNKPTLEDPTLEFVKPGDPANSYLVRKIQNKLSDIESDCDPHNALISLYAVGAPACGSSMPQNQNPLDQCTQETIVNWIQQGAPNN